MSIKSHIPTSNKDATWYNQYMEKMGEDKFKAYIDNVYTLLDKLNVGEHIVIENWVKPENIDLFVKIAYCFITESEGCYSFRQDYTQIKHYFDARQMEATLRLLKEKRELQNAGGDVQRIAD